MPRNERQASAVARSSPVGNVTAGTGEFLQRAAVGDLQTLAVEQVKQIADNLESESARTALHGIFGCAGVATTAEPVPSAVPQA